MPKKRSKKKSAKKSARRASASRRTAAKAKTARPKAKVRTKARSTAKKVSKKASSRKRARTSAGRAKTAPSIRKQVPASGNMRISKAAQNIISRVLERTRREDRAIDEKLSEVLRNQKALLTKDRFEIANQKKMLSYDASILKKENEELREAKHMEDLEEEQLEEIKKLEVLEKEIEQHLEPHPLLKVGMRDVVRGSVGALAGIVLHYTFIYGVKAAENLTTLRATALFALTFLVGFIFLYVTGFRNIRDKKIMFFLPVRLIILYLVSLITSIVVLWFFFPNDFGYYFDESYRQVATVMLPALIGACTADLIGKE